MDEKEKRVGEDNLTILPRERRSGNRRELSPEEIMKIARERGVKRATKFFDVE